ncbi:MAG: hypothetical protein GX941_07545 [Candidatus Methanofastidiosa archaeon]|jgi:hypothetical protein|nr:hypothetical protein [Candidatus Methanofastidiosa archaeon]
MRVINLTPHAIKLNDGTEFPPSGQILRIPVRYELVADHDLYPQFNIYNVEYEDIELPELNENTMYIVSSMVLEAIKEKVPNYWEYFMSPATGHPECIRDEKGQIVSVPGFYH